VFLFLPHIKVDAKRKGKNAIELKKLKSHTPFQIRIYQDLFFFFFFAGKNFHRTKKKRTLLNAFQITTPRYAMYDATWG
jgi:hypothetical protein